MKEWVIAGVLTGATLGLILMSALNINPLHIASYSGFGALISAISIKAIKRGK